MPRKSLARTNSDGKASAADTTAVREKVLAAFSSRAHRSGIRAVLMADLAAELRMSAMTLYKHFPSKDDLVDAMVDAWALELAAIEALDWDKATSCNSAIEVLLSWADAWTANLSHVSPHFFKDLQRDHPQAFQRYQDQIEEWKRQATKYLKPLLRDDLDPDAALTMLDRLVMMVADTRFGDSVGLSRRDAVRTAVSIWGGGALRQRATLRSL